MDIQKKKPSTIKRVLGLLKNNKKGVLFLLILIVIVQAANIAVPFITKDLIDGLTNYIKNGGAMPWHTVLYVAVGILVATLIGNFAQSIYNYHSFTLVTKTEDTVRNRAFEKYLQLHTLFHHNASSGQIIGRIERGTTAIYGILYEAIGQSILPPIIIFIGAFGALLYENVWIALAVVIPFPIYFLATRGLSNRIDEIEEGVNEGFELVWKESYDVAGNVLTVKKFSQEQKEITYGKELLIKARRIQYRAERLSAIVENIQDSITTVSRVLVIALSAWFVIRGTITIGQFVLFFTLQSMVYQPLSQLSIIFPRLRRDATRVQRLLGFLDEDLGVNDMDNASALSFLQKEIVFKNVSFSYNNDNRFALKDISVVIPANSTVALVGRSGSGKTTFINLLLRSFDPQQGEITFDGTDIKSVTQASLRGQIAVVPQEVDLFSRTIAENIGYGKPSTQEQIEDAAKTALAHDFIMKLENGYDTVVGERGIKLSGGERQRIGIARAVLRDPKLLILDEATSHLDTESERLITKATDVLIKNRTSVIIAHRLSTVLHADKIVVFKDGAIEAEGTHAELLHSSPTYSKLYAMQFVEPEDIV